MDVGADNFRFDLEDKNGRALPPQTFRQPQTTEVHLDSLDRYNPKELPSTATFQNFPNSQAVARGAGPIMLPAPPGGDGGTSCVINPGRAMAYGYFSRVAITQMYLNWEVPLIVSGVNDQLLVQYALSPTGAPTYATITIPQGNYTATTMASTLQGLIRAINVLLGAATVTAPSANSAIPGFLFAAGGSTFMCFAFGLPGVTEQQQVRYGRTAKLLGIGRTAFGYAPLQGAPYQANPPIMWATATGGSPSLVYTDYVDVVSQQLTNFKAAKDGNSSIASPSGVIARIWLTETTSMQSPPNNEQPNDPNNIGSGPFSLVKTWVNPNWSQWSPNQTLNSVDITLIDSYGVVLPWSPQFSTEWSATLTFSE